MEKLFNILNMSVLILYIYVNTFNSFYDMVENAGSLKLQTLLRTVGFVKNLLSNHF